jgi:hypothetical protein
MDRLAQGITNRTHRRTETEDQRIQDSHSQPHARFSTFFLRGTDEYRPVAAGTRRPQAAAAVSPRWRRPKQFSRPRGCICAARSFQLAVVVSIQWCRFRGQQGNSGKDGREENTSHRPQCAGGDRNSKSRVDVLVLAVQARCRNSLRVALRVYCYRMVRSPSIEISVAYSRCKCL